MKENLRKNQKGFTLVELIVVIAILGIMAVFLAPKIMGNVADANKQKQITAAETISSAITVYNAKALSKVTPGTTIPTTLGPDVTLANLTGVPTDFPYYDAKFPEPSIVAIHIDDKGNSWIKVN